MDVNQSLFERTELVLGADGIAQLQSAHVAVCGVGGVGSFAAEALVRSGIGEISLFDHDTVAPSNCNRQLIALQSTIGQKKVDIMKQRILDINPNCSVHAYDAFIDQEVTSKMFETKYDYVIDAIDTITSKLLLIEAAYESNTPIISAMGAGNKLDPLQFHLADIYQTSVCPLARIMRRELRQRNIPSLRVLYSTEIPIKTNVFNPENNKPIPASISFVPSVAGLVIAGDVIKKLAFQSINS